MKKLFRILGAAIALSLWASAVTRGGTPFLDPLYGVSVTRDLTYGSGATAGGSMELKLDVYRPTYIGQAPVLTLSPAVVVQHGGAWTSGSKAQAAVPATFFARHGFTVIAAQYRLFGDDPRAGSGPWDSLSFPFYLSLYPGTDVIRAGIEDAARAMAWTRANAATYGIDAGKISLAGGSAGGINALLHTYNNPSAASAPQAVVAYVATMYGNYNLINPGEPPAFLLNSLSDPIVPYYPDVEAMVERMERVGVYHEPWIHDLGFGVHDVDYNYSLGGETVLERTKDFLAYQLAGVVPEPTALVLGMEFIFAVRTSRRAR